MSTKKVKQEKTGPNHGWPWTFDMGANRKVEFVPQPGDQICVQRAPDAWKEFRDEELLSNRVTFRYLGASDVSYHLTARQFSAATEPTQTKLTISGGSGTAEPD